MLLETADILFAGTIRWTELFETAPDAASQQAIADALRWLSRAERAIADSLRQRPADGAASFAPEGSHSIEHLHKRGLVVRSLEAPSGPLIDLLAQDQRDALLNVEVAFEAVRALWSGVEYRVASGESAGVAQRSLLSSSGADPMMQSGWQTMVDAARANWTPRSVMMRHALRMLVVGAVDVLLMRMVHVRHGAWLAMTSIIVLQPYRSGNIEGEVCNASAAPSREAYWPPSLLLHCTARSGLILAITVTSVLTLATYAVDYAWYCFFLTPTFVLLS